MIDGTSEGLRFDGHGAISARGKGSFFDSHKRTVITVITAILAMLEMVVVPVIIVRMVNHRDFPGIGLLA